MLNEILQSKNLSSTPRREIKPLNYYVLQLWKRTPAPSPRTNFKEQSRGLSYRVSKKILRTSIWVLLKSRLHIWSDYTPTESQNSHLTAYLLYSTSSWRCSCRERSCCGSDRGMTEAYLLTNLPRGGNFDALEQTTVFGVSLSPQCRHSKFITDTFTASDC